MPRRTVETNNTLQSIGLSQSERVSVMLDKACDPWYEVQYFSYDQLIKHLESTEYTDNKTTWVFRGQLAAKELQTTLESECKKSGFPLTEAKYIEYVMLREFRRLYDGEDRSEVLSDTLDCLSLLRHHNAPTRLLDFTYSKYVALYFGLKAAYDSIDPEKEKRPGSFALWCIETEDMNDRVRKCHSTDPLFLPAFNARAHIRRRSDKSFRRLYMENKYDLVIAESPTRINKRLPLQQGVPLCPGNVTKPFIENLRYLYGSEQTTRVRKLVCTLTISDLQKAFEDTRRMNITEESLFPRLDGQARNMNYNMWFYKKLHDDIREAGWSQ